MLGTWGSLLQTCAKHPFHAKLITIPRYRYITFPRNAWHIHACPVNQLADVNVSLSLELGASALPRPSCLEWNYLGVPYPTVTPVLHWEPRRALVLLLLLLHQGLALGLVEPPEVRTGPPLQLVQVPLDGILSFWCGTCITQRGVVCRLGEGALDLAKSLTRTLNSPSPSTDP